LKHYPEGVKLALIQKILAQPHRSMRSIAKEAGICKSTLHEWITGYRDRHNVNPGISSQDRTLTQRLKAVRDCSELNEVNIGKHCRSRGIYRVHLDQWKELLMNDHEALKLGEIKAENKSLRKENSKLEKNLRKSEKQLAEAKALLELKKKVSLILEVNKDG
jgi:transposase-like protein